MKIVLVIVLLGLSGCAHLNSHQPVRWEHGWKTHRVIATRYRNEIFGETIGFTFPLNPNDCDRAEIGDLMELENGEVFQGGGSPGAEMFVKFKNVNDAATADEKMQEILPDLDRLMDAITSGARAATREE